MSSAVSTASAKYEVSKFHGGTSFSLWKIRMRSSLVLQGLRKAIEEKFSDDSTESEKLDLKERALGAIFMSVTDNVLREIAGEKSASAAWKKLEELYSAKSLTNRLYLKKKLYNLRMVEGTSIKQHLDEFNSIIMDLGNIDITVESKDQALIVLCSLPPSYEIFVHTLLYGKDNISLDDVSNALKSKELKKSFPDSKNGTEEDSLMTRGRSHQKEHSNRKKSRARSKSKSRMKKATCYECQGRGHSRRDCPKLKRNQKETSANVVDMSSSAEVNSSGGDSSDGEVLSVSVRHGRDSWILDSGATFHMCPHRHWFVDYKPMQGTVYLGDDKPLSVVGSGHVKLRMFDGVIRSIECWHIPGMKRNLISLSTLDSQGYKYHAEGGVLMVCRGSMVLIKGSLMSGLYVLQESVIIGEAATASGTDDQDLT